MQECWRLSIGWQFKGITRGYAFFLHVDHAPGINDADLSEELAASYDSFLGWFDSLRVTVANVVECNRWRLKRIWPTPGSEYAIHYLESTYFGANPAALGSDKFSAMIRWYAQGQQIRQSTTRFVFHPADFFNQEELSGAAGVVLSGFITKHREFRTLPSGSTSQGCLFSPSAGIVNIIGARVISSSRPRTSAAIRKSQQA